MLIMCVITLWHTILLFDAAASLLKSNLLFIILFFVFGLYWLLFTMAVKFLELHYNMIMTVRNSRIIHSSLKLINNPSFYPFINLIRCSCL